MSRPISEMSTTSSSKKIPNADELREEEKQLLKLTKEKQSVKNVLQQIKDMEAAEEAKKWKPPPKGGGSPQSSSSGPNYVNVSSSKPVYVNEIEPPKLPDREPPKKTEIGLPEKKEKSKGLKKLLPFGKGKTPSNEKQYTNLQDARNEEIYEEIAGTYSGTYEIPVDPAPQPPQITESPDKRRSSVQPALNTGDIASMSVEDVTQALKKLGLDKHVKNFKKNKVTGMLLQRMDEQVFVDEFRFSKFDAIKLKAFVDAGHVPE